MKTLQDVIKATEARGATVLIETPKGRFGELGCLAIMAVSRDERIGLTTTAVGPDLTIDDDNFDYYVADLDDPKTWSSSGVAMPPKRLAQKSSTILPPFDGQARSHRHRSDEGTSSRMRTGRSPGNHARAFVLSSDGVAPRAARRLPSASFMPRSGPRALRAIPRPGPPATFRLQPRPFFLLVLARRLALPELARPLDIAAARRP